MIADKDVAREISGTMLDIAAKLDGSIGLVQKNCSSNEFEKYRKVVGVIMAEMLLEVMNPIYIKHPDLKPKDLV